MSDTTTTLPPLRDGALVRYWPPGERVCKAGTLREAAGRWYVEEWGTGRKFPADGRLRYWSIDGQPAGRLNRVPWWVREVADA